MKTEQLLLVYFILYFSIAFVWSSWRAYQKTGNNPVVLATSDDAYGYIARAFKVLMVLLFFYSLSLNLWDSVGQLSGKLEWLELRWLAIIGYVLLVIGFVTTVKSQMNMGASWRIGIDTQNATQLVTTGMFSLSRNPIFLSMRMALLGQFLCLSNAVTFAFLALGEVLMQTQVRLEEVHLAQKNGAAYTNYRSKVRRWL